MKRMLVAKEVRQDLAAAQREIEQATNATDLSISRSHLAAARKFIAEAMRRLA